MKYYKVLDDDGHSCHGGNAQWSLPVKNDDGSWTPGEWMPKIEGELEPCVKGYHLCRLQDLVHWLGATIYEAEYRGESICDDVKVVVRECRLLRKVETWTERTARLFAVWCAREALEIVDDPDPRSIEACNVAERFANGAATENELIAARDAAINAVWDIAMATETADAINAARAAVRTVAKDAAASAAINAAGHAAKNAVKDTVRAALTAAAMATTGHAVMTAQKYKLLEILGE